MRYYTWLNLPEYILDNHFNWLLPINLPWLFSWLEHFAIIFFLWKDANTLSLLQAKHKETNFSLTLYKLDIFTLRSRIDQICSTVREKVGQDYCWPCLQTVSMSLFSHQFVNDNKFVLLFSDWTRTHQQDGLEVTVILN